MPYLDLKLDNVMKRKNENGSYDLVFIDQFFGGGIQILAPFVQETWKIFGIELDDIWNNPPPLIVQARQNRFLPEPAY